MWKIWNKNQKLQKPRTLVLLAALAGAAAVWACGPSLDYDTWPHAAQESSWLERMMKAETEKPGLAKAVGTLATDENIKRTEALLKDALGSRPDSARVLAQWRAFRAAMLDYSGSRDCAGEREDIDIHDPHPAVLPPLRLTLPAGLPPAFALYEEGALILRTGKADDAISRWEDVLQLPEDQRKWRGVNAAYMLGRTSLEQPETCAKHMAQCRALAAAGCPDPEGLAAASWGWEARAWLDAEDYEKAISLYFTQAATGDSGAVVSLNMAVSQMIRKESPVLVRVAKDDQARKIVAAVLVNRYQTVGTGASNFGNPMLHADAMRWMDALEMAQVADREDSAILAWFAYESGRYDRAEKLAQKSPSPMCAWIRAKLALRRGDEATACKEMEAAAKGFEKEDFWAGASLGASRHDVAADAVRCELAELRFKQGDFVGALTLFHEGGANVRADYLADRILTTDELKAWVAAHPWKPVENETARSRDLEYLWKEGRDFRWLLARRLVREWKLVEARPYFPPEIQVVLDRYVAALKVAQNAVKTKPERAEAWWQVAEIERRNGLELMGTHLTPDYFVYGGNYDYCWSRQDGAKTDAPEQTYSSDYHRFKQSAPVPDERFHYHYLALDHAWSACELMKDNTDALAQRLWTAGKWVAARDPKAADRFYKALVTRCGKTAFGRDADARRWFPPNPPGQAQPPIRRLPPTPAQVWKARIKAHPWPLAGMCAAGFSALITGVWMWRKKRRRQ